MLVQGRLHVDVGTKCQSFTELVKLDAQVSALVALIAQVVELKALMLAIVVHFVTLVPYFVYLHACILHIEAPALSRWVWQVAHL